jgi:glycosyltransferase 2 family protein
MAAIRVSSFVRIDPAAPRRLRLSWRTESSTSEAPAVAPGVGERDARPILRRVAAPLLSLVSLAGVAWWASNQEPPRFSTSPGDLAPLVLALAVYAAVTLIRGWRWHRVLLRAGIAHRRTDAFGLVVVGYMGNNVLPARGGELLRVLLMAQRAHARKRDVLGSVIAERLVDVVVVVGLFTLMTVIGLAGAPTGWRPVAFALGLGALGVAILGVTVALRRRGRFQRAADLLRPFVRASHLLIGRVGAALVAVTALMWLFEGTIYWLVGQSLNVDVALVEGMFLVVLLSFVGVIPAAPGYLGTFDAALLFGLEAVGVTGGEAVAFLVLIRSIVFVPITLTGLALMLVRYGGIRWSRLRGSG